MLCPTWLLESFRVLLCVCVSVSLLCVYTCMSRPEQGVGSVGAGITGG